MVILGFLPTLVRESLEKPNWKGRVEYLGTMAPEAYFRLIKHVRADVGLAPLLDNHFNQGKSAIKWIENTAIGIPTVASNCSPYAEVIEEGSGFLCTGTEEWEKAILTCLDDKRERQEIVNTSRICVSRRFDIKSVARTWRNLLLGE